MKSLDIIIFFFLPLPHIFCYKEPFVKFILIIAGNPDRKFPAVVLVHGIVMRVCNGTVVIATSFKCVAAGKPLYYHNGYPLLNAF